MSTQKNFFNLKAYNTFGFDYHANHLIKIYSIDNLAEVYNQSLPTHHILGGGSNILLTKNIEGYVLKCEIKGIHIEAENEQFVEVTVGAGEVWHQFVLWALSQKLGGIENLSLIPGTVGAAPIQNIGAYGVEQKEVFVSLKAFNLHTGELETFDKKACKFGYRDSFFKGEGKGAYFITHVTYRLTKTNHNIQLDYGDIRKKLDDQNIKNPSISDISDAVIYIRKSKLPDPANIGNAGSFFKNPIISRSKFESICKKFPNIPFYEGSHKDEVKIPAGWLIDQLQYKGRRNGNVGVHDKQALVLVHYGNGKGHELYDLASEIKTAVFQHYDIPLEMEVNIW